MQKQNTTKRQLPPDADIRKILLTMSDITAYLAGLLPAEQPGSETQPDAAATAAKKRKPAAGKASEKQTLTEAAAEPAQAEQPEAQKPLTKEDVRAILSAKACESDGIYKSKIRALVKSYAGGGSLTDVNPKDYAALAAEVEAMGNA